MQNKKTSERLRERLNEKQKEAQAKARILDDKMKMFFNSVAESAEGREVFRYIKDICNYNRSKLAASYDSRVIDTVTTTVNAAMETIWLKCRRYLSKSNLNKIENNTQGGE